MQAQSAELDLNRVHESTLTADDHQLRQSRQQPEAANIVPTMSIILTSLALLFAVVGALGFTPTVIVSLSIPWSRATQFSNAFEYGFFGLSVKTSSYSFTTDWKEIDEYYTCYIAGIIVFSCMFISLLLVIGSLIFLVKKRRGTLSHRKWTCAKTFLIVSPFFFFAANIVWASTCHTIVDDLDPDFSVGWVCALLGGISMIVVAFILSNRARSFDSVEMYAIPRHPTAEEPSLNVQLGGKPPANSNYPPLSTETPLQPLVVV